MQDLLLFAVLMFTKRFICNIKRTLSLWPWCGSHIEWYLLFIQSPTLHSRCRINKGLIKRGSTIDHWRSRCKGWILWPTPYTYIHTYITYCLFTFFIFIHENFLDLEIRAKLNSLAGDDKICNATYICKYFLYDNGFNWKIWWLVPLILVVHLFNIRIYGYKANI
jgi:hypothetical protein